jgi:hypothetical protein
VTREALQDGHSATRDAALNGAAIASMALGSGIQLALYLRHFGTTRATDAMIAALAVYSLLSVAGQVLRTTSVPLLSGSHPSLNEALFGWTIASIALAVTVACAACAEPIANLVAHSAGHAGTSVATTALRVMAPAIGLQIGGGGLAVLGALRGRLGFVALAYVACGGTGVVGYFALERATGIQVLAWTNVISGGTVVAILAIGLGFAPKRAGSFKAMFKAGCQLLQSVPLPMSFALLYPVTLALIPRSRAGEITLFGLAYTVCSYLSGITAQALSMSDVVSLARLGEGDGAERRSTVVRAYQYSLLLAIPAAGVAALAGGPILIALTPSGVGTSGDVFGVDVLLLIPFLVGALGVWATLPALLSTHRDLKGGRLLALLLGLLTVHAAATVVGRAVCGFDGAVLAMAVAPTTFVWFGLRLAAPGTAPLLLWPAARICGLGAISFGPLALAIHPLAHLHGALPGIAGAGVGAVIYAFLAARVYPAEAGTIKRLATR